MKSNHQHGMIIPKIPTPLKSLVVVILILLSLWGFLNAFVIGLVTVSLTPMFVNLFTSSPIILAVAYLCYIAACAAFAAGSGVLVYTICRILQQKPLALAAPIILVGCIITYLLCSKVILPIITGASL